MPVVELRQRMSNAEFVTWTRYHARRAQREELAAKEAGA
jgi:hypothetical protein